MGESLECAMFEFFWSAHEHNTSCSETTWFYADYDVLGREVFRGALNAHCANQKVETGGIVRDVFPVAMTS